MLPLLLAALGAPGAAPFVLQVASWCSGTSNDSSSLQVALSMTPLLCGDLWSGDLGPCVTGGPLGAIGLQLSRTLLRDPRWGRRLEQRRRLCRELPGKVWPLPTAPPRLRIVPERSGAALSLTCHAWGFAPAAITLRWLRDGVVVDDAPAQTRALPTGDGTFRAQATIETKPGTGDTFECLALHPSLEEPVSVAWAPGLSRNLGLLVALAVLTLLLGLLLFIFGLCRYLGPGYSPLPGATYAGYSPLPGDTYAGSI